MNGNLLTLEHLPELRGAKPELLGAANGRNLLLVALTLFRLPSWLFVLLLMMMARLLLLLMMM